MLVHMRNVPVAHEQEHIEQAGGIHDGFPCGAWPLSDTAGGHSDSSLCAAITKLRDT